jgi:hypothetical protein
MKSKRIQTLQRDLTHQSLYIHPTAMGDNMDNNKTLSSQLEGTLHITPTQLAEQSEIRQPSNCKQLTNFTCTPIQYPYTPMSFSQNWMTSQ